jgi:nucleotide-binding universal stress UspA family protein
MQKTAERAKGEIVIRPNTFGTLLVHAEPGLAASPRVEAAGRLARDLGARLIGLGAETFEPVPTPDPFTGIHAGEWVVLIQEQIDRNLAAAETAFRRDTAGADIEWRVTQDYPHRALGNTARAADLIVVSPRGAGGPARTADPADVVMSVGRPVLMVPEGGRHLRAQTIVVAWKDTRECRRAVADAMPLLQRAESVIVVAAVKPADSDAAVFETQDVVDNLKRHGVEARAIISTVAPEGVAAELARIAAMNGADLIVAGAFGHSRAREWAFGGVTDDFLRAPPCFVLLSH